METISIAFKDISIKILKSRSNGNHLDGVQQLFSNQTSSECKRFVTSPTFSQLFSTKFAKEVTVRTLVDRSSCEFGLTDRAPVQEVGQFLRADDAVR
jgi:hypothetical protein